MKRTAIALALMACGGAALAQSSVTLYGRIDTSVAAEKLNGDRMTRMSSGLLSTSRLGFRGSEDLGGGTKALFNLEATLLADDGNGGGSNGLMFDRQSWAGLSSGFGTLRVGRTDTVLDDIRDLAVVHNLWDSEFSPTKIAYTAGVGDYSSRASNQVRYDTPSFGGFSASAGYGLDEEASPVRRDVIAYNVRYRGGPLDVGVAYQQQKHESTPGSDREYTALAASYRFDALRVSGGYQRAENGSGVRDDEYSVGVAVPLGAFELSAGYAHSESETAGAVTAEGKALAVGATYALSKRTRLYAAMLDGEVDNGAGTVTTDRRLVALGVRHDF